MYVIFIRYIQESAIYHVGKDTIIFMDASWVIGYLSTMAWDFEFSRRLPRPSEPGSINSLYWG